MEVSVVVCTYNRCELLRDALSSLLEQKGLDGLEWEILVVDNNSADGTDAIVRRFESERSRGRIRPLLETTQGVAHARNRGVREATGRFVAFIDDDEIADSLWLCQLMATARRERADCVGGRILVRYPEGYVKPRWLLAELEGFIGRLDYGDSPLHIRDRTIPLFTGNVLFRRGVFGELGLFDIRLGRRGKLFYKGEDVEMVQRAVGSGFRVFYEPKAIVHHRIEEHRLRKGYFRRLHFMAGKQSGLFGAGHAGHRIFGIPLFLFPQLLRAIGRYLVHVGRQGVSRSLRKEMTVWHFLGYMTGCFRREWVGTRKHRRGRRVGERSLR